MYSFPEASSSTSYPNNFQDADFSGRTTRQDISSYESMDAGLTIKTREGDIVTLSTSRFSSLNASQYTSQGSVATEEGQVSASYSERQIELASGETFSFSVEGDLNEQELADIESIISGVDSIIYEMAEGDMEEAVALALSMGTYDSVYSYEADITVARGYSYYSEIATTESVPSLAASGGSSGYGTSLLPSMNTSFMDEVAGFLEDQEAEALAYAQQPLSQLFDYYLEQQAEEDAAASEDKTDSLDRALKSPTVTALENAAKTVELLIQELVKDVFDKTLDELV